MSSWYDMNAGRAYPFVRDPVLTGGDLSPAALLDAGFVLGAAVYADADAAVYLTDISSNGTDLMLVFATAPVPSVSDFSFTFSIPLNSPRGSVHFVSPGPVGETADPRYGSGFVVVGDLTGIPVGDDQLPSAARVEPALVRSERGRSVYSVSFANDPEVQVAACDDSESSSSGISDSSESPGLPQAVPVTGLVGMQGTLIFSAGYNATARVDTLASRLVLGAQLGAGLGQPCGDIPRTDAPTPEVCQCTGLIYSVNGLAPGPTGDIPVSGGPGLTVTPDGSTLRILIDSNSVFRRC